MVRNELPWQRSASDSFRYTLPPETEHCGSPEERLRLLESEHQFLLKRQEQLLTEATECDYTDRNLLTVVNRLRSVESEIERTRSSGR